MGRRTLAAVVMGGVLACVAAMVWAGLRVDADKENVVASRLVGKWKVHVKLTERLTGRKRPRGESGGRQFEFKSAPNVAAKVPEKYSSFLKGKKIYLAGMMKVNWSGGRAGEHPFILIAHRGNPHVVYFRPRGGDPMGDAESFNVMLAVAKDRANDLLFVGGDFNNQPFSAFQRAAEKDK